MYYRCDLVRDNVSYGRFKIWISHCKEQNPSHDICPFEESDCCITSENAHIKMSQINCELMLDISIAKKVNTKDHTKKTFYEIEKKKLNAYQMIPSSNTLLH